MDHPHESKLIQMRERSVRHRDEVEGGRRSGLQLACTAPAQRLVAPPRNVLSAASLG
jgi:hypothetical protein